MVVKAEDYTGTTFIVRDPIISPQGGTRSSSPSYELYSSIGQLFAGQSSSTLFTVRAGFLYYPEVTTPVVTASAGNESVTLSWTAATAELAGSITQYEVGKSTVAGSSYSFTNVEDVLTTTQSNLTGGTPYYFVVRALDAQNNAIATSAEVSATPIATNPTATSGGSGGGYLITTGVTFKGRAYPNTKVIVLQDGGRVAETIAGPDAEFTIMITGLSAGSYSFGILAEDRRGIRSTLISFPIEIMKGAVASVGGIFIAPSADVDKKEVRRGDTITVFGQSIPRADIIIKVNSKNEFFTATKTDTDGVYVYALDTSPLEIGGHTAKAKSTIKGTISPFGTAVSFSVTKKIAVQKNQPTQSCAPIKGDLNGDCRVNIVDFSILAHWYNRPSAPVAIDMNNDGKINLKDFSIMAFYWSG